MKYKVTENEFSILDDNGDELLSFKTTIDGGVDVVITGTRRYIPFDLVDKLQLALVNLYNTGTFDREG